MPRAEPKLLAVKLADLGDALTATPALRALRQTWPAATIDVLTSHIGRAALKGLDSIDHIYVIDKHRFDTPAGLLAPGAWAELLSLLQLVDSDAVVTAGMPSRWTRTATTPTPSATACTRTSCWPCRSAWSCSR